MIQGNIWLVLIGLAGLLLTITGCGGDSDDTGVPDIYQDWDMATHGNVKVFYPSYHVLANQMTESARLYGRQVATSCRVLQIPIPAETLVVYHYTGFGQGREMTGREYPFAEDSVIHFWTPSHRGTTVMHYLLPKWIDKEPTYEFLKHGLYVLLDASGKNYHSLTMNRVNDGSFIPLVELAADTTVDSNLELHQSAEAASFVDFMLFSYGVRGLAFLYRAESDFAITVEGLMGLKADSLQAEWLDFADKAARGELPAQKQLQKQLDSVGAQ